MNAGKNRLFVALGSLAAIGVLLAAFVVVWLVPRGPDTSNAKVEKNGGTSTSVVSTSNNAPAKAPAGATVSSISDQPRIVVQGTGNISVKPDLVNLQVGVQVQKDKLQDAQSEASTKMDAIMNQLKASGVEDKDIATAQYSVEPVMTYNQNEPPKVTGFRVTNIVNVKLHDTTKAGKLIDDLVNSGANTIYGLSFGFSDPSAIMKQARAQAVADARSKAEQLATLSGVSLGAPLLIQDSGSNVPPVAIQMASDVAGKAMGGGVAPAINPGQQEIRVDISVEFAIK